MWIYECSIKERVDVSVSLIPQGQSLHECWGKASLLDDDVFSESCSFPDLKRAAFEEKLCSNDYSKTVIGASLRANDTGRVDIKNPWGLHYLNLSFPFYVNMYMYKI